VSNQPIEDPLETEPPRGFVDRKIVVRPGEVTTFRLMHDPKDTDQARWFAAGERNEQRGNEVTYLVRGEETYAAMAEAIKLTFAGDATQPRIIYLLGWSCDLDIPLVSGDSSSSLRQLLKQASSLGVEIRCMLWANLKGPGSVTDALTAPQVKFINKLPTGRAILDSKTALLTIPSRSPIPLQLPIHTGSHHQKVLVTNGKLGLIAFCGGIDFSPDRLGAGGFQDVHCKVRGPAANDLLQLFVDRWSDYLNTFAAAPPSPLEHDRLTPEKEVPVPGSNLPLLLPLPIPKTIVVPDHSRDFLSAGRIPAPGTIGDQVVQTGRTTPKGIHLRFRPQGEQSVRSMILKGIESAQSFIYMEDQYVLNPECADALSRAAAKSSVKHITILLPDDGIDGEFFGVASFHRADFVKRLRASAGANKIQIFCSDRYVHSKIYIFDDKYAIIGSANCNRRGWEHDSEVVVGIFDESKDDAPALHFAKRLRMKLWADHFNLHAPALKPKEKPSVAPLRPSNTQDEYAELADGVGSAVHWRKRAPQARIRPYGPTDHRGKSAQQVLEEGVPAQLKVGVEKLSPSLRGWASLFNSVVEAFPGVVVESVVWDHVLDPPSSL
jgi:phosphatidylserine/phosphatidylglycerophosphate/cardiolipin synthase-like enzyme